MSYRHPFVFGWQSNVQLTFSVCSTFISVVCYLIANMFNVIVDNLIKLSLFNFYFVLFMHSLVEYPRIPLPWITNWNAHFSIFLPFGIIRFTLCKHQTTKDYYDKWSFICSNVNEMKNVKCSPMWHNPLIDLIALDLRIKYKPLVWTVDSECTTWGNYSMKLHYHYVWCSWKSEKGSRNTFTIFAISVGILLCVTIKMNNDVDLNYEKIAITMMIYNTYVYVYTEMLQC